MTKLYYSDGREVRSGDVIRDLEYDTEDEYAEEFYSVGRCNGKFTLDHPMGTIGDLESVEDYELVERWEATQGKEIIRDIKWLLKHHEQGVEFDFYLKSQLKILQQIFENIK